MASFNVEQMLGVPLPENVKVVMQTGGTEVWADPREKEVAADLSEERPTAAIDPSVLQRYEVNEKLTLVDEQELDSMGDAHILYDFLSWGVDNYPAEKMGVIFWNHGGAIQGICVDEIFDNDRLMLFEVETALDRLYDEMTDRFEFIGFDACLMGSIETADLLVPHGRYMYASEETEPGFGWNYTALLTALAQHPDIDGDELGEVLCNGYFAFNRENGLDGSSTLSVTDLAKVDAVLYALNDFAAVLNENMDDPAYLAEVARRASRSEQYFYEWMIDLGDFAEKMNSLAPEESAALAKAVDDAVIHNVSGSARAYASGLSIFYPTVVDTVALDLYDISFSNPEYTKFIGSISKDIRKHIYGRLATVRILQEPAFTQDGIYAMQIDPETLNGVREMGFGLFLQDEGGKDAYFLGTDDHVILDWETGVVEDDFNGYWAHIDGQPLSIFLTDSNEEYSVFQAPISLNGRSTNLMLKLVRDPIDPQKGKFEILGTWSGVDADTMMASRVTRTLQPGDSIRPIYMAYSLDAVTSEELVETDDLEVAIALGDDILVGRDTEVVFAPLEEGRYLYQFMLTSVYGNDFVYAPIAFDVSDAGQVLRQNAEEGAEAEAA